MTKAKGFYSKNFKLNAVKLYINRKKGESIISIANKVKIASVTLQAWILAYRDKGEEGLSEKELDKNSKTYETLKINSLQTELDVIQQAYNGLKRELDAVMKDRDNMRKAIEVLIKSVRDNSVIG